VGGYYGGERGGWTNLGAMEMRERYGDCLCWGGAQAW